MKTLLYSALAFLGLTSAAVAGLDEAMEAVVRISVSGGIGTGTVFIVDEQNAHILTNAHVADSPNVHVQFYRNGQESQKIPGRTVWRGAPFGTSPDHSNDMAVVVVPLSSIGYVPPAMPIAEINEAVQEDQPIVSMGCPSGSWPTMFKARVVKPSTDSPNSIMTFYPGPKGGRSGSAIYDEKGTHIVGIVTYILGDGNRSVGGAMSLQNIHRRLGGKSVTMYDTGWTSDKVKPIPKFIFKTAYG